MKIKALLLPTILFIFFLAVAFPIGKSCLWGEEITDKPKVGKTNLYTIQYDIDENYGSLTYMVAIEKCIDSGNIDDAKYLIRLRQDKNILCLYADLGQANERSRLMVAKLFKNVAKHRAEVPFVYRGELPKDGTNSVAKVALILSKYK